MQVSIKLNFNYINLSIYIKLYPALKFWNLEYVKLRRYILIHIDLIKHEINLIIVSNIILSNIIYELYF